MENTKYDKAYDNYKIAVQFSSNPYDRNIVSVKEHKTIKGLGEFKIGDDFTKEQFIEKMKTDSQFCETWKVKELLPISKDEL